MQKALRSWVTSPLGYNLLLSPIASSAPQIKKYVKLKADLTSKKQCRVKSRYFYSISHMDDNDNKHIRNAEIVDFNKDVHILQNWVNKHTVFNKIDLKTDIPSDTKYVLINASWFESTWSSPPFMKVYNSFNYTQDVKYEARLLEIPLRDNLKFVILVPNETDVLQPLYLKLANEGLSAAINSIQPLFTVSSDLTIPKLEVESRVKLQEMINKSEGTITQYGYVLAGENGVQCEVVTCMYSTACSLESTNEISSEETPFFFGIIAEDTPIFIGKYIENKFNGTFNRFFSFL